MNSPIVLSPSQTIGPLYGFALMFDGSENAVDPASSDAVTVRGRIFDAAGDAISYPEAMVEIWKEELFARTRTAADGEYHAVVRKPAKRVLPDGETTAPYLNLTVFARGLMKQVQTRLYFPDETDANAADPTLRKVDAERRSTLVAVPESNGLVFDIRLQGDGETVFFEF